MCMRVCMCAGVVINGVHLQGGTNSTCKRVTGTYTDCEACAKCDGLSPAQP